jgi:riboflavin synthase
MFTGIVRGIGKVVAARRLDEAHEITIEAGSLAIGKWHAGDSVCVSGVCLTVTRVDAASFTAGVSAETRMRTTLGTVASGDRVNLEPALAVGDALGGHWVTGHVDGTARVTGISEQAGSLCLAFEAPPSLARYLAPKGSIALDGVSLTINEVANHRFGVTIVPYTRANTTLADVAIGQAVNLEIDIVARYLARLFDARWQP